MIEVLAGTGIETAGDETLKDIADRHETSPSEIYEIIRAAQQ